MALGGGTFVTQNKVLPGAYINFVSKTGASATLSDRGIVTMPLILDWGADDKVFEVTSGDFQKNSMKVFGRDYADDSMKGLRDLFLNAQTAYFYRLNGGGNKAKNGLATAKYSGTRGNDLTIIVETNVDDESMFDVTTKMGSTTVDTQTVSGAADLEDNDYVKFDTSVELALTAGTPLAGGTNGTADAAAYQKYLDKIESYRFNTMGVVTTDETIKSLVAAFTKRLRDEMGIKFQAVLYRYTKADYMGVISVENKVTDDNVDEASAVYWVTGAEAGCAVNKSVQNTKYAGEFTINTDYTQNQLIAAIKAGKFMFHQVDEDVRVLEDINTMVTTSDTQGEVFQDNQTIRVCDQIGNDDAVLFNTRYLGVVPNDASGRTSLWADIVKLRQELQDIRAIEDFTDSDVTVEQGDTKKAVVVTNSITVVNAMGKLYMTVVVA
jgi:hypothetical protein